MFQDLLNNFQKKLDNRKQENDKYKELLTKTTTFQNLFPIPNQTVDISEYKVSYITNTSPDINKDKAQIISKLIPLTETYLTVIYSKEILTNTEYFIVPTDKYLWIISEKNYGAYPYQNLSCHIIKNNLMSKIILLGNVLLEANGNDENIKNFINIINDINYRTEKIKIKTSYLCGIIPIYQKINSIGSGISISKDKIIVFHTQNKNYKYSITDIENYEILLDNTLYTSRKIQSSKSIGSFQNGCYQISIRITDKDQNTITIPILEPNSFSTKYNSKDSIFQKNIKFATDIIAKLNELYPKY